MQELREAVSADSFLSKIINMLQNVKRFVTIFKELYIADDLLIYS